LQVFAGGIDAHPLLCYFHSNHKVEAQYSIKTVS